jgi:broad specificity phosphatase PhoE
MNRVLLPLALAALGLCMNALAGPQSTPALVPAASAVPEFQEKPVTAALVQALRKGGYVIYLRHATTDTNRPDRVPQVDLADCSTQRPLTDPGRKLAARIGQALRQARIPVDEVWVSPMCRTRETTQLAFGERGQIDQELMPSSNMTAGQKQALLAHLRQRLSTPVTLGSNRVLVSHASNLADLLGYFIAPEGTAALFAPKGNGQFEYLASIHPDDWPALSR